MAFGGYQLNTGTSNDLILEAQGLSCQTELRVENNSRLFIIISISSKDVPWKRCKRT